VVGSVFLILFSSDFKVISEEILPSGLDHIGYRYRVRLKPV